jgi:hypothetical protein
LQRGLAQHAVAAEAGKLHMIRRAHRRPHGAVQRPRGPADFEQISKVGGKADIDGDGLRQFGKIS